jgi:hypothetical protein
VREDFMEQLDKMFPDGYIVLYTNPNSTFRMSLYNPHKYELIESFHNLIKEKGVCMIDKIIIEDNDFSDNTILLANKINEIIDHIEQGIKPEKRHNWFLESQPSQEVPDIKGIKEFDIENAIRELTSRAEYYLYNSTDIEIDRGKFEHSAKIIIKQLLSIDTLSKQQQISRLTKPSVSKRDLIIEILVAKRGCSKESAKIIWDSNNLDINYREDIERIAQAIHNLITGGKG